MKTIINEILCTFSRIKQSFRNMMAALSDKLELSILKDLEKKDSMVFGPVPSRRLGYSLGVNTIKHKSCTYNCIYCQNGKTTCCSTERNCCINPYELYFSVKNKIEELNRNKIGFDYITFLANGEPTLDNNLSGKITILREFAPKTAVFTNGSLLWNDNVKENLRFADYVSIKTDTADEAVWERMNRPHCRLHFARILNGIREFATTFKGALVTETMLVRGFNDSPEAIKQTVDFLKTIERNHSYFTIPIRPTSEKYATAPEKETLKAIAEYIKAELPDSSMLCCDESNDYRVAGTIEDELLAVASVQPLREKAVREILRKYDRDWNTIKKLIDQEKIMEIDYADQKFYSRIYSEEN